MDYIDALRSTVNEWNVDPIIDEWVFEKFREQYVESLSPEDAFDAIEETTEMLLRELDESTATELVQTIIALARHSGTTQVPSSLLGAKSDLQSRFHRYGLYARGKLAELWNFYRIG